MKAYYLVFVLTLLLSVVLKARTDKQWRWKLFLTFLPLFVFGAIRVDFGNDYSSYEAIYESVHSMGIFRFDTDAHAEIGYQLLNRIMPSFRLLLVLSAFLLSLSVSVFCYHNVPNKYLWLFVLLMFLNPEKNVYGTLVAMRSGLCVSAFLLCFVFIQKRKLIPFALLTVALSFIHTSAAIFLPLAYIVGYNKPFTKKEIWVWVTVVATMLILSQSQLFDIINLMIGNDVLERYEDVLAASTLHRGLLAVVSNVIFVVMLLCYLTTRGNDLKPGETSVMRVGILYALFFLMGSLAMRASYFYNLVFLAAVVRVYSDSKADSALRYGLVALVLLSSYYSMYHIWMGADWWNHGTYHCLLGDW